MALHNISEAAKLAGCSRPTLQKKIKSGELSISQVTVDGQKKIDTSELIRVFGQLTSEPAEQLSPVQPEPERSEFEQFLREQLDRTTAELERERQKNQVLTDKNEALTDKVINLYQLLLPPSAASQPEQSQKKPFWKKFFG